MSWGVCPVTYAVYGSNPILDKEPFCVEFASPPQRFKRFPLALKTCFRAKPGHSCKEDLDLDGSYLVKQRKTTLPSYTLSALYLGCITANANGDPTAKLLKVFTFPSYLIFKNIQLQNYSLKAFISHS